MKAQNKEEKLAKQQEREKLQREIAAREKAEKLQVKYLYFVFVCEKSNLVGRKKDLLDSVSFRRSMRRGSGRCSRRWSAGRLSSPLPRAQSGTSNHLGCFLDVKR